MLLKDYCKKKKIYRGNRAGIIRMFYMWENGELSKGVSAGFAWKGQEENIFPHIKEIIAVSAGAMVASYFLTNDMIKGHTVFDEDLTHDFTFPNNIIKGIAQRYKNRRIKTNEDSEMLQVMDVDYVMDIVTNIKPIDFEKLSNQPIPFYVKVTNIDMLKEEYFKINGKSPDEIKKILKASISAAPYTTHYETFNENKYVDGSIINPVNLDYLLEKYPDDEIILVINSPQQWSGMKFYAKAAIEWIAAHPMYGGEMANHYFTRIKQYNKNIKRAKEHPRVHLIHPPKENPTMPKKRDPKLIKITKGMGRNAYFLIERIIKES